MDKVLLVEDEQHIAKGIKINLEMEGFEVELVDNGVSALEKWENENYSIIVLDLMLPKLSGIDVLKKIRATDDMLPILILTAKDGIKDKVYCLKKGVDDYLTKPFDLEELLLRIKRLVKRSKTSASVGEQYVFGPNKVCFKTSRADCPGGSYQLTAQEIKLLKLFFENPGVPISRQKIVEDALGYDPGMSTRTVDNFIVRFRKYFEKDPKNPIYFKSLRSIGYFFEKE